MTLLKRGSRGAAVNRVQGALGVPTDGIYGPVTENAVRRFQQRNGLTVDGVVGPETWGKLFKPVGGVGPAKPAVSKTGPIEKTIAWERKQLGTTESPANSNRGPQIDVWQREVEMIAQPWCGAFQGAALRRAGVKGLTYRIRYCPFIREDAKLGRNGFIAWLAPAQIKRGDLVLFDWERNGVEDHVGIALEDYRGIGTLRTLEGNTSSDNNGSQSNGGGVYERVRSISLIAGGARPDYGSAKA